MLQRFATILVQYLARVAEELVLFINGFTGSLGSFIGDFADSLSKVLFVDLEPRTKSPPKTLEDSLDDIASELRKSGGRAQKLIDDAEALIDTRARQVESAKIQAAQLEAEVAATQARLDELKAIRPEAASAISGLMNESLDSREARAGRRDLILFVLGALFSGVLWVISEFFLR